VQLWTHEQSHFVQLWTFEQNISSICECWSFRKRRAFLTTMVVGHLENNGHLKMDVLSKSEVENSKKKNFSCNYGSRTFGKVTFRGNKAVGHLEIGLFVKL